jgi:hypothetical protein
MEKSDRNIDEYLGSLADGVREDMAILDGEITKVMAGEPKTLFTGKLWGGTDQEIIGYGTYSYVRSDKEEVEWFIIGLALQKNYISVYVSAVEDRQYVAEKYGKDVGKVKVGKSSISFKNLEQIDLGKLLALIARAKKIVGQDQLPRG